MWLYIFADVDTGKILTDGVYTAQRIASGWDQQWVDLLKNNTNNNLYGALTNLGTFFAVGTLLFFMVQWLRDLIDNEYSRPISALIWPFVVVALLANPGNGTVLSNLTLGVRNFINVINYQVVTTADIDQSVIIHSPCTIGETLYFSLRDGGKCVRLHQSYQQALNMSVAEEVTGSLLRPCQSLIGQQQINCFIKAEEKIVLILDEYKYLYGEKNWMIRLRNKVNQIVNEIEKASGNVPEFAFNSLLGSTVQTTIKNILISLQSAFQNLIEVLMLLIAALGPLAVGGSLLPVAGKPIYAWLTGLISMGIAKISFNIIAMLTSRMIVDGLLGDNIYVEPDLLWFLILLGLLGPIFSLVIAIAGGFAVFNAISNTAVWMRERV